MRVSLMLLLLLAARYFTAETKPDPDKVASLRKGETYDQVVSDLGPPTTIKTTAGNSKIVGYGYIQQHLSGPATTEAISLKFDQDGIPSGYRSVECALSFSAASQATIGRRFGAWISVISDECVL